jgi:hypothetical protein
VNIFLKRKKMRTRFEDGDGYDFTSPVEKVVRILTDLRDSLDTNSSNFISGLNYCIDVISTNKLYDMNSMFSNEGINWWEEFEESSESSGSSNDASGG